MRKYALLKEVINEVKKIMIYSTKSDTYVFLYNTLDDTSSFADYWYASLQEAEEDCEEEYSIKSADWINIADPQEHCQHDIISPVRVKGRVNGNPQWDILEKYVDGKWIELKRLT